MSIEEFDELGDDVARALRWENIGSAKLRRMDIQYRAQEAQRTAQRQADNEALWADLAHLIVNPQP